MTPAQLNDLFRRNPDPDLGRLVVTRGVADRYEPAQIGEILRMVRNFDTFTADNDPYGLHDFGSFTYQGQKMYWKIDAYSRQGPEYGSEDPADPRKTSLVLTVLLPEEY